MSVENALELLTVDYEGRQGCLSDSCIGCARLNIALVLGAMYIPLQEKAGGLSVASARKKRTPSRVSIGEVRGHD